MEVVAHPVINVLVFIDAVLAEASIEVVACPAFAIGHHRYRGTCMLSVTWMHANLH